MGALGHCIPYWAGMGNIASSKRNYTAAWMVVGSTLPLTGLQDFYKTTYLQRVFLCSDVVLPESWRGVVLCAPIGILRLRSSRCLRRSRAKSLRAGTANAGFLFLFCQAS